MRRLRFAGVLSGLVALVVLAWTPLAAATTSRCLIINDALNASYKSLQAAQDAASSADTLWVRGRCVGTTTIRKNLTITGQQPRGFTPPTLDGAGQGSVLTIDEGLTATINALTISNGDTDDVGGGIIALGTVTLNDSTVSHNVAGLGGGIASDGTVTLNDSTVRDNTGHGGGGGILSFGTVTANGSSRIADNTATDSDAGGVYNLGTVTLNDSAAITGNTAHRGGGIRNDEGTVTLNDSSAVTGNTASDDGGGIWNGGAVTLNDGSAVSGNTAANVGGGVYNASGFGTLHLAGGTVSGNTPDDVYPSLT